MRRIVEGSRGRRSRNRSRPGSREAGTVTAELAVVLPAVLVILAVLLAGAAAGTTQLRLEEAARAGARELARGESPDAAASTVQRIAGAGASINVSGEGNWAVVQVSATVQGPLGSWVDWPLTAQAAARSELSPGSPRTGGS
jgi:Flp pilus assembly protein TadG